MSKGAIEKLSPRPPSAAACAVGVLVFALVVDWMLGAGILSGVAACGRLGNHERAPCCGGSENTRVPNGVKPRCGDGSRKARQEGEWVEIDGEGAIGESAFEGDTTQAVVECLQA